MASVVRVRQNHLSAMGDDMDAAAAQLRRYVGVRTPARGAQNRPPGACGVDRYGSCEQALLEMQGD